jgi:tRNA(Ile)-lysidine synthase
MKTWEIFYKNSNNLIKPKDKIIIAVSGGADSMCLLHLLYRLSKKIKLDLIIVHFDHGLRKESQKEASLVQNFAQELKIPFIFKSLETKKYSKENKISIETAGRDLRYKSLVEFAKEHKFNKISTAHNANDNAETMLMRILRGSGSLAGIPQSRKVEKKIEIIRPILNVKRILIEDYVKKHKIPFCTDKSNFDDKFTRNKVRLQLLPIFEQINPLIIEHLSSLSEIQSRQEAYLDEISQKIIKKSVKFTKNSIFLDLNRLLQYNQILLYRVIKSILPEKKNSFQINLIIRKILSSDNSLHRLSSDWIFQVKSKNAVFKRLK